MLRLTLSYSYNSSINTKSIEPLHTYCYHVICYNRVYTYYRITYNYVIDAVVYTLLILNFL